MDVFLNVTLLSDNFIFTPLNKQAELNFSLLRTNSSELGFVFKYLEIFGKHKILYNSVFTANTLIT